MRAVTLLSRQGRQEPEGRCLPTGDPAWLGPRSDVEEARPYQSLWMRVGKFSELTHFLEATDTRRNCSSRAAPVVREHFASSDAYGRGRPALDAGRSRPVDDVVARMITSIVRRWRRRAVFRAWARGDLDFAGALPRSPGLRRLGRLARGG